MNIEEKIEKVISEDRLKKIATRLTDRFYRNLINDTKDGNHLQYYDGLYQDVLQQLVNVKYAALNIAKEYAEEQKGNCVWFDDGDSYLTSCHNNFVLTDGILDDCPEFKYCPYCSGFIKESK